MELDLPLDLREQRGLEELGRREELAETPVRLVPRRQVVEELGHVVTDFVVARQHAGYCNDGCILFRDAFREVEFGKCSRGKKLCDQPVYDLGPDGQDRYQR